MDVDINGENVVTVAVPAGTYAINATYTVMNDDTKEHQYICALIVNGLNIDSFGQSLGDGGDPSELQRASLAGAITFTAASNTIAVNCDSPDGSVEAHLVAVSGTAG